MEAVVRFTPKPEWETAVVSARDVMDFVNFSGPELTLRLVGFEGASDPVIQIAMETGMQYDKDFTPVGRLLALVSPGDVCSRRFGGLLRFARWNVVQLDGATAAWFTLVGKALP